MGVTLTELLLCRRGAGGHLLPGQRYPQLAQGGNAKAFWFACKICRQRKTVIRFSMKSLGLTDMTVLSLTTETAA